MVKTKIVTGKCRFAYVNLFVPRAVEEGQVQKYSLCLLIPKGDRDTIDKIIMAVDEAKKLGSTMWGGKVPENLKLPLKYGDLEKPDMEEFQGHYFLNVSSKTKPGVVDKNINEIKDSMEIYSGCYGRASIYFYPYSLGENKGVACGLLNVQKIQDGQHLGITTKPEEDFKEGYDILG